MCDRISWKIHDDLVSRPLQGEGVSISCFAFVEENAVASPSHARPINEETVTSADVIDSL